MRLLLCLLVMLAQAPGGFSQSITLTTKKGNSGSHYTFFKGKGCQLEFTDKRPEKQDASVMLCIPAAFTNTGNDQIDGVYAVDGNIGHATLVNKTLGGVLYLAKGQCRMFQSGRGRLFGDSLYRAATANKASFFQQIQCIEHGRAASFIDQKRFQRRGIAILKDHSVAVVESHEAITLKVFSDDLVALGVVNLIYTDMGAWDEGWYRDPTSGTIRVMGLDRSQTARQSNWFLFRK